jgi:small-conductance mechanosensitive channel
MGRDLDESYLVLASVLYGQEPTPGTATSLRQKLVSLDFASPAIQVLKLADRFSQSRDRERQREAEGLRLFGEALNTTVAPVVADRPVARPGETVIARLVVLGAATALVVAVAALTTAFNFTPAAWLPFLVALVLLGLVYGLLGALAGAVLDRLAATYLILFLVMVDIGVVQTPMFHETPGRFAWLLPGYGPSRVMYEGAFSDSFHAAGALAIGLGWLAVLGVAVYVVLRRAVGQAY